MRVNRQKEKKNWKKKKTGIDVSSLNSATQTEIETVALIINYVCTLCSLKYIMMRPCAYFVESVQIILCAVVLSSSFCFIIVVCDMFCYGTNDKCQQAFMPWNDHNIYFRNWIHGCLAPASHMKIHN